MRRRAHIALHVVAALGLACMLPAHAAGDVDVVHELDVRLDPGTRSLQVSDTVALRGSAKVEVGLRADYRVETATLDGRPLAETRRRGDLRIYELTLTGSHRLHLRYTGAVARLVDTDHRGTLGGLAPMAGERGSYLPAGSGWYPMVGDAPARYALTLRLPAGQRGLSPGRQVEESDTPEGYRARYVVDAPTEGIEVMAGPYVVRTRDVAAEGTRVHLSTWFHPEIAALSGSYLDAAERYVAMYSARLGAYPFERFSIVSGPLPTGFGMPTLTYLGIDVLRLPFIRATSLGHEVLHNWWGNGVYVDYHSGNWAEGLTTFMADYAYKEAEGPDAARTMRLDWLRDYAAVPEDQDMSLRSFTARTHGTSQIIGYNKGAFVFYMLRARIGEEAFDRGLRRFWQDHRFRRAGWSDLRRAFEEASAQDLDAFFLQWLERPGAPRVRIERAQRVGEDLHLTLTQRAPAYAIEVPVEIERDGHARREILALSQPRQHFVLREAGRAETLVLDPRLHVFRMLDDLELPPILRNVMVDRATRLSVASEDATFRAAAKALAHTVLDHPPVEGDATGPLMLVAPLDGIASALRARGLPTLPPELGAAGTAKVWTVKDQAGATVLLVAARDAQSLAALQRGLPHYGRQSWLVFEGPRAIARGTWPAQAQRAAIHDSTGGHREDASLRSE